MGRSPAPFGTKGNPARAVDGRWGSANSRGGETFQNKQNQTTEGVPEVTLVDMPVGQVHSRSDTGDGSPGAGKPGHEKEKNNMSSATSSVNSNFNNIVNSQPSTDTTSGPQQQLTQNNFLQLLVAQMENQDPLQPQSDTQMAAQMAQFTSLSQTSAMSTSLSAMQANSLIGATVTVQQPNSQSTTSGVVEAVRLGSESSDGTPQIVINGIAYDLKQVLSVTPTPTPTTSNTTPSS